MSSTTDYYAEDLIAHFPKDIGEHIEEYANEEALKNSRYIFTRREGKKQYGYCTHCKAELKTQGLKHNEEVDCPECGSSCTIKSSGRGRSTLIDEVYFVYYEKSLLNPKAIVARGIYAARDYRGDYSKVETKFITISHYVFEMGNSRAIRRYAYYSSSYGPSEFRAGAWERCKTITSEYNRDHTAHIRSVCSYGSIKEAIKGTPFSWSCYEKYIEGDMVKFFDLYAKYPCIEYLTKLSFNNLVRDKLNGNRTYGTINWRGKNLFKVLKLNKQELNEIKKENISISFLSLKIYQTARKDGSNISLAEAHRLSGTYYKNYYDDLEKTLRYGTLRKITGYLSKQHKKDHEHYWSATSALTTWKDYIADCIKLEMDLTDESVLFPNKLHNAHQNTIKQVKATADERLNKEIKKRAKALEKYRFEYQGLIIRPVTSSKELINEGKALHHCVGTYADRYAKGQTNIFVIRKASKPDKPFYTVEIRQNEVIQTRGNKNCSPDKAIASFMEVFKSEKLNTKKSKVAKSA